ncbi:MAG: acetylornithine deacetylase [Pseudomonadota bacterium]
MDDIRAMIERLVGFDTVSRNSNLPLIEFVEARLAQLGVESHRVPNADGTKANLYATIGPMVSGGVVLSGHTDVVPVDGQEWDTDPFQVVEKDGKLYGRGTADMKSFVALALALAPEMTRAGLKRPIHFAFSYDEEVACLGAPDMIREMAEHLPPCEAVIVGEPTEMKVVTGNKGILCLKVRVRGHEVHSSRLFEGASAVMAAARLVAWCDAVSRENRAKADPANPFDPPYSTLHSGVIQGGTADNITAKEAWFTCDFRNNPPESTQDYLARFRLEAERIEAEMKASHPSAAIEIEVLADVPGLVPEADGAAERLGRALTGDNGVHVEAYAAEAGQFQEGGFSVVMCGPGSIAQAHRPNEFIALDQIEAGAAFMRRLIERQSV